VSLGSSPVAGGGDPAGDHRAQVADQSDAERGERPAGGRSAVAVRPPPPKTPNSFWATNSSPMTPRSRRRARSMYRLSVKVDSLGFSGGAPRPQARSPIVRTASALELRRGGRLPRSRDDALDAGGDVAAARAAPAGEAGRIPRRLGPARRFGGRNAGLKRRPQVGAAGFEPATSATQTRRSARLSYAPMRGRVSQAAGPEPSSRARGGPITCHEASASPRKANRSRERHAKPRGSPSRPGCPRCPPRSA
jgi:hypothetical protein